jgi:hypothetical protein
MGCCPMNSALGQAFFVDAELELDLAPAGASDVLDRHRRLRRAQRATSPASSARALRPDRASRDATRRGVPAGCARQCGHHHRAQAACAGAGHRSRTWRSRSGARGDHRGREARAWSGCGRTSGLASADRSCWGSARTSVTRWRRSPRPSSSIGDLDGVDRRGGVVGLRDAGMAAPGRSAARAAGRLPEPRRACTSDHHARGAPRRPNCSSSSVCSAAIAVASSAGDHAPSTSTCSSTVTSSATDPSCSSRTRASQRALSSWSRCSRCGRGVSCRAANASRCC